MTIDEKALEIAYNAENSLEESLYGMGNICLAKPKFRKIIEAYESAKQPTPAVDDVELCNDEGCPHYGEKHICIRKILREFLENQSRTSVGK